MQYGDIYFSSWNTNYHFVFHFLPANQELYSKSKCGSYVLKSHWNIKNVGFILRNRHNCKYVYTVDGLCLRLSHAESKAVCDTRTCTRGPKGNRNTLIILVFTYILVLADNKKFSYMEIFSSDFARYARQ